MGIDCIVWIVNAARQPVCATETLSSASPAGSYLLLIITPDTFNPMIHRTIAVPYVSAFDPLHRAIQASFQMRGL